MLNMLWEDNMINDKYKFCEEIDNYVKHQKINIRECKIDRILLQSIRKNYVINLFREKVSDAGCKYICDNIAMLQNLQILDMESIIIIIKLLNVII